MPPKTLSSVKSKANKSNKEASQAIDNYISDKPDFEKLIKEAKENSSRPRTDTRQTEYSQRVKEAVKEVLEERRAHAKQKSQSTSMPSESGKETIIAKEAPVTDDSVSEDPAQKLTQETEPSNSKPKAKIEHHKANPGPVMADNLGPKATKEELKKRAEELNKK